MTDNLNRCTGCKQDYPIDFYAWKSKKKNIRHRRCKNCTRAATKQHFLLHREKYDSRARTAWKRRQIENRQKLYAYLAQHPCITCGESDLIVLQLDHRDPLVKFKEVSVMLRTYGWKAIQKEIDKCDVLCANCHARRTAKQFNWYRYRASQKETRDIVPGV